ncbi:putative Transmembrane protein [Heracleum sosnowskyi]|uniref:Transmembrane protein n=1 Tax=Heracleum sosnowskyi TaxID=360622 RepID=A0AAD8MF35_9APIA|nr:putative Transmembrane protein [Heracleum sosnowskyi]
MSKSSFTSPTQNAPGNKNTTVIEQGWVIQIRKNIEEELDEENISETPVCIYSVPTSLVFSHPEAYTPQQVALGPYHHWRQELYGMERHKIVAARRTMKHVKCFKTFPEIVDRLQKLEPKIRACYHKYLTVNSETLTWMMAIDVPFLLDFLEGYAMKEGLLLTRSKSRFTASLLDCAEKKASHVEIMRDILMLENQIPLFLLRKLLEFELGSSDAADDTLLAMLKGLSIELYPLKTPENLPKFLIQDSLHILDFFYRQLMPKDFEKSQITDDEDFYGPHEKDEEFTTDEETNNRVLKFFNTIFASVSKLNIHPVRLLKLILNSKPLKVLLKMPWTIITKLPILNMLKGPIEKIFRHEKEDGKAEDDGVGRPPLIEELTIPSVTVLAEAGVLFVPTDGGICSTNFDVKTRTLSLPRLNLDVNAGIIMRNMVAYESCHASGPLIFSRYTEFMNGIVDTKDDVKFLREKGIILNRLKSDEEAANLWNGMNRSVKLTKVPFLDKVVGDVNTYYNGRWKVKAKKYMRSYIYGSWRILTVLACLLILGLLALQTFCSVYSCSRVIRQYATPDSTQA